MASLEDYSELLKESKDDDPKQLERPQQKSDPLPKSEEYFVSAANQLVVIIALGVVSAVACGISVCDARRQCTEGSSPTCKEVEGRGVCAFENIVGPQSDVTYNSNVSDDTLAAILRGICSPGDRFQMSVETGEMECIPYFPSPEALNSENMDPSASEPHMKACGKWIDAGGVSMDVDNVVYRSMEDHESWLSRIKKVEDEATKSSRTTTGPMGRFRAECMRTVRSGSAAIRMATELAYRYLVAEAEKGKTENSVLRYAGYLASHYCDGPVRIGMYLSKTGQFVLDVEDGWLFSEGVLAEALHIVGEPKEMQEGAEAASKAIRELYYSYNAPALTTAQVREMVKAGTGLENFTCQLNADWYWLNTMDSIISYNKDARNADRVQSYMRGVAAYCSNSLQGKVASLGMIADEVSAIRADRSNATQLGKVETVETVGDDVFIDNATIREATKVTISQLGADSMGDAEADCLELMRAIYPDEVDDARFKATVNLALYDRLQALVLSVRVGVHAAVTTSPIKEVLANSSSVANNVLSAGVRIAGAPRGSWAGIGRQLPSSSLLLDGSEGVFVMALKQARALFKDRIIDLVFNDADPCDHVPFSSSTTLNAYAIPVLQCAQLFLGMATKPWLDSQYTTASLVSRGVAIVGHELAHMSLNTPYINGPYQSLLAAYHPSTRSEAIADVIAVIGVVNTGIATASYAVKSYCQLWCARLPIGYTPASNPLHPGPNDRCDFLHATLAPYFNITF